MPFVRIDVAEGIPSETKRELLRRSAELFAEITESPIERVRSQVVELPGEAFAVGGIPLADAGVQAPFITVELLAGRPPEQHRALIEQVSALVADLVGAPIDRVRLRINEVPPELWGIAGVPAAEARKAEVEARGAR